MALFAKHPGVLFEVCPMSIADGLHFRNLKDVSAGGVRFENLSMAQVGALVSIQLTHVDTKRTKRFAVKVLTEMDDTFWEERRIAFLKDNFSARDFRALLRYILFGGTLRSEPEPEPEAGGDADAGDSRRPPNAGSLLDDFTIEDVLHSCTEDSSRIDEIDRLIKAFEDTKHVDASFVEFWANFREAVRTVKAEVA